MNLTSKQIEYLVDQINDAEDKSYSFPSGIDEIKEMNNTSKTVLPEVVKIDIIMINILMKRVMTVHSTKNELLKFNERSFCNIFSGYKN